jgi:hypothetical protein
MELSENDTQYKERVLKLEADFDKMVHSFEKFAEYMCEFDMGIIRNGKIYPDTGFKTMFLIKDVKQAVKATRKVLERLEHTAVVKPACCKAKAKSKTKKR